MKRTRLAVAMAGLLTGALALTACGSASGTDSGADGGNGGDGTTLSLVGFSTPKAANEAVEALWQATTDGQGVTFNESYGASGDQSRAVAAGLHADVVHFSLSSDMTRLVDAGLVAKDWDSGPTKGILTDTTVVFVVRKGNPKHITSWADLIKPGVQIVTPNPGSSGSARWNVLAGWGDIVANGGTEDQAKDYMTKFFQNVVALPGSARDATTAFQGGTGDVLLSYESEAILARQNGADLDYVLPDTTLLIENPGAVTVGSSPKAKSFLDFALSKDGQTAYAEKGWRPLDSGVSTTVQGANDPQNPFPAPTKMLTIGGDFGGWSEAGKKFFDPDSGIITKIMADTGKS